MNIQEVVNRMMDNEFKRSKDKRHVKERLQYRQQVRSLVNELLSDEEIEDVYKL